MSTVKIRSLTTTAPTTASDDFLVIDGTTNSTRKLNAATPAFLTSVTVPTVATAAGVNLNLATGTAASDKVLIPGTLEATAADGLAASVATLGGASVKKALWVGGIINVAGHTTFEGVTSTGATGTGKLAYDTSPSLTTPALGTPSALVGTNITGTAAGLTAGNVTTNANLTGDVTSVGNATSIAAGVIVNADINAAAAIVDTKLDTIATALKVSNSATTAASANTASAIVARDASGNFSAGTVSAALAGNAATATALATGRTIAITGDLAYTSPSFDGTANVTAAGTLATVATAGATGSSTAIPIVTINAKGLTTSITTAAVIAPAGTLTGATLASGVTASSLTSLGTIANLTATAGTITSTPTASTDIANKLYVDTVAQGLDAKASCVAATTANITLSGTQTIDGISVIAADRVLVKNQTLSQNNGIYLCAAGAWTRTTDADSWDELTSAFTFIETGTANADTGWVCTANAGGTLGTTALPWSQFSGAGSYTASTGLTLTGTAFSLTAPVTIALGGTNATSAGIAAFNNISGFTAAGATGTTSTNLVFSTSPTLITPALGTPTALVGTNITGTATAFTASNVTTNANLTGAITSTGNATLLGSFSSANLAAALTDETGTGANVFATSPTLVTPALGTPASGVVTNLTGTASININGTVGATTPAAGAFTTLNSTVTAGVAGITLTGNVAGNPTPFIYGTNNIATGAIGIVFDSDSTEVTLRSYGSTFSAYTHAGVSLAGMAELWVDYVTTPQGLLIGIHNDKPMIFANNNTEVGRFTGTGLAVTGTLSATSGYNGTVGATTPAAGAFTTVATTSKLSTTPTASANSVQGVGGSFVTVVALPSGWGTVHVTVSENGTVNIGYYQVDFVNGAGIAIQARTGTTAGATTSVLTFQLSGSNLQARGANVVAPHAVKYWIITGTF